MMEKTCRVNKCGPFPCWVARSLVWLARLWITLDVCQRSFCIGFAFLSGESENDFFWAFNRLKSLYIAGNARFPSIILTDRSLAYMNAVATYFPSSTLLLCRWHANKAVLAQCQKPILQLNQGNKSLEIWKEFYGYWHSIIQSPDEEIFYKRVTEFEDKYLDLYLHEVGYIKETWLNPYKEKLVQAWVDQHLHFGNITTSRVEGIHAVLKEYLKRSDLNLFEA